MQLARCWALPGCNVRALEPPLTVVTEVKVQKIKLVD